MAERLVNLAKVFVGFIRGGLALVNILASTMFGCISGSSVADTASIGSVMIPQMIKNGYPRLFAVNVTIAGSLQPLLVPAITQRRSSTRSRPAARSRSRTCSSPGSFPALLSVSRSSFSCLIIAHRNNFPKGEVIPLRRALKIALEAVLGTAHRRHHHRRNSVRYVHAHRIGRRRLRLLVPGHDVRLSRLKWSQLPPLIGRVSCALSAWS